MLLLAALLFWFLPAWLAVPWLQKRLGGIQLHDVHGLLWDGGAEEVLSNRGQPLGRAQWQLSRRIVLGQPQLALQLQGPQLNGHGAARQSGPSLVELSDMQWHVDLALLSPTSGAWGAPRGWLDVQIPHAQWQGVWPLQLEAHAQWNDAHLLADEGDVALGQLQLDLQGQNGVIGGSLHDDGQGPLQVQAQLQLSPLGWRLTAILHPRQATPALSQWLLKFGQPDVAGDWHIERHGGLASEK